jgi:hypothetical protein
MWLPFADRVIKALLSEYVMGLFILPSCEITLFFTLLYVLISTLCFLLACLVDIYTL